MNKLLTIVIVLSILTGVGVAWFWLVEGWPLLEAAYMTVITLSTVGFEEVQPLSNRSRVFVILYLVCGLGVFLFAIAQLGEMVVRAELRSWIRRRGMNSALKTVSDHFIVCGYGRMGKALCQQLARRNLNLVVIDMDPAVATECESHGWPCVMDDATDDQTLKEAGIERARGLAVVLDSDADNLFVVLSARLLAPELQIIARASDESSAQKMEKAGANRVVSLFTTGAATMAQQLINPTVEDFFEFVSGAGNALDLAEIRVVDTSNCCNRKLSETNFRDAGVIIVAIRRAGGEILMPPPADTVIRSDDVLVALGEVSSISKYLTSGD